MKVLLFEPGTTGHRPVILRYIANGLRERGVEVVEWVKPLNGKKNLLVELQELGASLDVDLIHILTIDGLAKDLLLYPKLVRNTGLPIVASYYLYNNLYEWPKKLGWDLILRRGLLNGILISDEFHLERGLSLREQSFIFYVPDPWDPSEFELLTLVQARHELGLPEDKKVILFFGELSTRKGLHHFLEALCLVRDTDNLIGLLAGRLSKEFSGGSWAETIEELVRSGKLIVVDRFIEEGEVATFFSATDFVACTYPSDFKVSSGTFTRACAAGKPPIVPSGGVLSKITEKYKFGIEYQVDSPQSLASALTKLAIDNVAVHTERLQEYAKGRTNVHLVECVLASYRKMMG